MPYVSCMYAPPDPMGMDENLKQGETARITCIDDQDRVWWLTEDSQVGDWLRYVEEGKTVAEYDEAAFAALSAPPEAPPDE